MIYTNLFHGLVFCSFPFPTFAFTKNHFEFFIKKFFTKPFYRFFIKTIQIFNNFKFRKSFLKIFHIFLIKILLTLKKSLLTQKFNLLKIIIVPFFKICYFHFKKQFPTHSINIKLTGTVIKTFYSLSKSIFSSLK